jgi:hypothetical protein
MLYLKGERRMTNADIQKEINDKYGYIGKNAGAYDLGLKRAV